MSSWRIAMFIKQLFQSQSIAMLISRELYTNLPMDFITTGNVK